ADPSTNGVSTAHKGASLSRVIPNQGTSLGEWPAAPTQTARNLIPSQALFGWSGQRLHGCCAEIHCQSARPRSQRAIGSGSPETSHLESLSPRKRSWYTL